eukprot:TRINITY_DN67746_c6_g9_i1.p1 TRINITY_DN67746_c6_g9~~TRINITY_DN67746_c6_g9_i1.p1  ORF type:complete len:141 (-),score=10.51 TRINITY_DN67746_c6_g9_i1:299-721(-)
MPTQKKRCMIVGHYANGVKKSLSVGGLTPGAIELRAHRLRNQAGELAHMCGKSHKIQAQPTIQGKWSPFLWIADGEVKQPTKLQLALQERMTEAYLLTRKWRAEWIYKHIKSADDRQKRAGALKKAKVRAIGLSAKTPVL